MSSDFQKSSDFRRDASIWPSRFSTASAACFGRSAGRKERSASQTWLSARQVARSFSGFRRRVGVTTPSTRNPS